MTDYPASRRRSRAARPIASVSSRHSGILAIFVFILLIFVIVGGFLQAVIPNKTSSGGDWDGKTSLAIVVNSQPPSIWVYAKEGSKIGVFTLPDDLKYATGNAEEPIKTVGSVFLESGDRASALLSSLSGTNISKFIYSKEPVMLDEEEAKSIFKDFTSIKTPFAILMGKQDEFDATNLSKAELLRLWWEVKGLTLSQLAYYSLSDFSEEIMGEGNSKFKGLDRQSINREMTDYFDGVSRGEIEVVNNSGAAGAGALGADMLNAYGWNVVTIASSGSIERGCRVLVGKEESEADLLASLFGCNIIRGQNTDGRTVISLGSDFAVRYF